MKTRNYLLSAISIIVIISTLLAACQAPERLKKFALKEEPLPPQVIQVMPAPGEEMGLDAPLQFVFDQPMDAETVEAAFSIKPRVRGQFEWPSPRMMQFKPAGEGFERATEYTVSIDEKALSAKELELSGPVRFHFTTVGFLEVGTVQPVDGATEIATDTSVTVLFNRPVVALTAIEEQGDLPQPLTFEPPVEGRGEWLNTSIYRFTPDEGFAPATTYAATVEAGLQDTTGGVLADDFTWTFTTVMPAVVATYPDEDTIYVSTDPTIHVAFNQPMAHASAEAAFKMKNMGTGEIVGGTFEWHAEGLALPQRKAYEPYQWSWEPGEGPEQVGVETMSFTPDRPLAFDSMYRASLSSGAKGAAGQAGTQETYIWTFSTIAPPRIISSDPVDGEQFAPPKDGVELIFSSPMDPDSLKDNFTISPPVSETEVYTYWWDSYTHLRISFPTAPSADHQVTISDGLRGRYGHKLEEGKIVRWHTRALDPMVYLHSPSARTARIATYSAYTETRAYVTVRNVGRVDFALYRMPVEDFLSANGRRGWNFWEAYAGVESQIIRRWTLDVEPPLNQSRIYGTDLAGDGDMLEPGLYFLKVQADLDSAYPETRPQPAFSKQILIVSRHNLSMKMAATETLVWATNLRFGDVLPSLPITVMDEYGNLLAEGVTDRDGVFFGTEHQPMDRWKPVFAFAGDPDDPGPDFAAAISRWDSGISSWDFDLPTESYTERHMAYFFTDRPIYRPGQTVYFKGILRGDDDAHYSLPSGPDEIAVEIWDAQHTKVLDEELTLSEMGTLDGKLELDEEAAVGFYSIQAEYMNRTFGTSFQVAEYRKPEFKVSVETDRMEYVQGDEVNITAQATYFFGGPVTNAAEDSAAESSANVRYSVLAADHFFNYQGEGRWDFTETSYYYWPSGGSGSYGELVAEGEGSTDAEGRFTFSVDTGGASFMSEKITSQRLTLEATVTDINNQEVSNRTEVIVHKGLYYIGLRPERYVGQAGEENSVNLITVDWQSEPVPDREVTVIFAEHEWYSVRKQAEDGHYYWESSFKDTPVFTTTATTGDDGEATVNFTPPGGGSYKVIASGRDAEGNEIRSSTYMWISGSDYVNWRQRNDDRIELVTDKRQYEVGDTATVLVPHPYQGQVKALFTLERGHIYEHWVQTLETNSEQIEIPITEDLIPNVFLSVVIVRGENVGVGGHETHPYDGQPFASFKVGYAQLPIDTAEKELNITLTPDKASEAESSAEHYRPGETVTYDVRATDSAGNPVEAEVALNLVDKAVLTLADRPGPGIVETFWRERGLGVNTASGLTLSGNRISEELADEAKGLGGGGGGGGEDFGPVRQRFVDLAYWNPDLRTGADGHAQVSVELPDNLTTWRMGAHAVTAETLVGEANVDIVSTKDLLVRPVAPRFFVVGDEAELAAVVHNNTAEDLEVEVRFESVGLRVRESASQRVSLPANDKVKVTWSVTVEEVEEVTLRFGAKERNLSDAIEISLPVYRYSTPEVVATAGQLKSDGQRVEAVALPPSFDPTQGELAVHIDPSLAAGMADGLDYLEYYPYECTEQTVSRFLPNVVTYRAFKKLGIERPELEEKLPGLVSEGLQRLYNQQHHDGGWGWWVQDESRPYLTAYVLLGLVEAQQAEFAVDEDVIEETVDFLQDSLGRPRDLEKHWEANRQAFILYALAEAGEGDLSRTVTLFKRRASLDTFGKAYLAMAFGLLEPEKSSRVDTLLSDISGEAIISATGAHWEEEQVDYYAMNTDTRSTAIVLAALARLAPSTSQGEGWGEGLAANAVRWLMAVREDGAHRGAWETTQETAWAVIALTDWMVVTRELEGAYDWQVVVNGEQLGEGSVDSENVDETAKLQIAVSELLADEANRVVIERWPPEGEDEGSGRLYYSMYLRYFKPVEEVTAESSAALNRGVIVSRRYTLAESDPESGPCPSIEQAQVGDTIRVKLTIIAPHDLHYVVVEDHFPAGAEGIDQSLKTTSVVGEEPELTRTDRTSPWGGGWGWWWFSHSELRDEKAVLFAYYLPRGTYEYTYLIRASLPGEFGVIPTHAYEMYFPEVFGRGDGGTFTITE
jgi:alpha-2-macroglobulin